MDKMFTTVLQKEINEEEMSVVAWGNKSDIIDRSYEIIDDDAWDLSNFEKNPVIALFHDYHSLPVGRAAWTRVIKGQGLRFKVKFAPTEEGREIFKLYKEGFLNAFSIGGRAKEIKERKDFTKNDIIKYTRNGVVPDRAITNFELFEISVVVIPDNMNALVERSISGEIKTKAVSEFITNIKKETEDKKEDITKIEDITKPETTENYHRIRVEDPDKFIDDSFRTIDISDGIKAVIGKYKSDPEGSTHIQTYLFDIDKFTMEEAQSWVDSHKKELTQNENITKEDDEEMDEDKCDKEECVGEGCEDYEECKESMKKSIDLVSNIADEAANATEEIIDNIEKTLKDKDNNSDKKEYKENDCLVTELKEIKELLKSLLTEKKETKEESIDYSVNIVKEEPKQVKITAEKKETEQIAINKKQIEDIFIKSFADARSKISVSQIFDECLMRAKGQIF